MANINKVRVGGAIYNVEDSTARTNASNAQSAANSAQSAASSAQSTANSALAVANGKASITNVVSAPWLKSEISNGDQYLAIVSGSVRQTNCSISTAYGSGMFWTDVALTIPVVCQPPNGFYSVTVTADMLTGVGAVTCVVRQQSKAQIIVRLLNPISGTFTFDLMVQAYGF
jgi:hypothetical protein